MSTVYKGKSRLFNTLLHSAITLVYSTLVLLSYSVLLYVMFFIVLYYTVAVLLIWLSCRLIYLLFSQDFKHVW